MILFRIENENDLNIVKRSNNICWMDSGMIDEYVASEIQHQVNGANSRNIFSFSRSLAIPLFKYNYMGDNPLIITEYFGDNILIETEMGEVYQIEYDIRCLEYPIKNLFPRQPLLLHNFLISVDNYHDLEVYLKHYTGVGRKKIAAVERDFEIVAYDLKRCIGVFEYIDTIYVFYALQLRYNFMKCYEAKQYLFKTLNKIPILESEKVALRIIIEYLTFNWKYEKTIGQKIVEEKVETGRLVTVYDSYTVACDILAEKMPIDEIKGTTFLFPMNKVTAAVWESFEIFERINLNV